MMKKLIPLAILLLTNPSHGKFALNVFNTPCEQLKIRIIKCKDYQVTNKHDLSKKLRKRKDIVFVKRGALVSGKILERKATKCYKKHKIDLKRYKLTKTKPNFFIDKLKCKKALDTVKVLRPNYYCDTPGTATIFSCYINTLERKNNFEYTTLN